MVVLIGGLTLFQAMKVIFTVEASRSQKTSDYVHVDRIVCRNDYGAVTPKLDINSVGPMLSMEFESECQKNALKLLPVNWG
jgi:hypothetical protein